MTTQSQNSRILKFLQKGGKITPIGALYQFGCFRLAARCSELRAQGYAIQSKLVKKGDKFVSQYSLTPKA